MSLADRYKKKSDIEHVLGNPDTYMGSVVATEIDAWVMVDGHMQRKTLTLNPGLLNLFYEGVVNCSDHTQRQLTNPVTYISAAVADGVITLENDGDGIDVALHPEHGVYIPELIFAHLRTSTNYDPSEKKIVGGKNGFGVKLVLIWSTEATVETVDATRQLKYTQTFRDNLIVIEPPVIKACKKKPYTRITFKPDYGRFGMPGLTEDMQSILRRIEVQWLMSRCH
jgi:DNA topoisomerase-2